MKKKIKFWEYRVSNTFYTNYENKPKKKTDNNKVNTDRNKGYLFRFKKVPIDKVKF